MKKIFLSLFLLFFTINSAIAEQNYTVLKTTNEYSPVRVGPNIDAVRFSHLKKGIELYSQEQIGDFYKINFGLEKPCYIEKKYVEAEKTTCSLELNKVKSVILKENKEFFMVRIKFNSPPPYQTLETQEGLDLNLFNINVNGIKRVKLNKNFKIIKDKKNNLMAIRYCLKSPQHPLMGYGVEKKGNILILKIRKMPEIYTAEPLEGIKIVIDPGHGGNETGAYANCIKEKDVNLQIAQKLKTELEQYGTKVYLTRDNDDYVDLYKRVDFMKAKEAFILLSIHQNSLPNPKDYEKKHGAGVYYYNKQSRPLANEIQKQLLEATKFKDDGVNHASFVLTRPTEALSVLIECGYLIHPYEAKMLSNVEFQIKIARAIRVGVENYLRTLASN